MKIQTSELTGAALDWAVAKCERKYFAQEGEKFKRAYSPSTDWSQGGPIIEEETIDLAPQITGTWIARAIDHRPVALQEGCTPLIAAMRCYVASKLGDTIEIPEELL